MLATNDPLTCFWCGITCTPVQDGLSHTMLTRDHIIPRSHLGPQDRGNLRPACRLCNEIRGDMTMPEFLLIAEEVIIPHRDDFAAMLAAVHETRLLRSDRVKGICRIISNAMSEDDAIRFLTLSYVEGRAGEVDSAAEWS